MMDNKYWKIYKKAKSTINLTVVCCAGNRAELKEKVK